MARSTTRIPNLTRATSLSTGDIIPFGPANGDRAKGIAFQNFMPTVLQQIDIDERIIINASSFADQNPSGTDSPLQIEFGTAVNGPTDAVQMSTAGLFTFNQKDEYDISFFFQYGRVGAAMVSWLFWRLLVNGTQTGNSVFAKLTNADDDVPIQFEITRSFNVGDTIAVEIIRDSQGSDTGGLLSETPTPVGWSASPSANIVIRRTVIV